MKFERKHKVFKKIVCDTYNDKNVLKTLAERHQNMMAFYLLSQRFFKPTVQTSIVDSVFIDSVFITFIDFIDLSLKRSKTYCLLEVIYFFC